MNLLSDSFDVASIQDKATPSTHSASEDYGIPSIAPPVISHYSSTLLNRQQMTLPLPPSTHPRCPSPLKQMSFNFNNSSERSTSQSDEEEVTTDDQVEEMVVREGKKWGAIAKMREEKRSQSDVVDPEVMDRTMDQSGFVFSSATECSLIADEGGSFLLGEMNSFVRATDGDDSEDFQRILNGLDSRPSFSSDRPLKSTFSILPSSLTSSTRHALSSTSTLLSSSSNPQRLAAMDDETSFSLLNCSTASYVDHRDSPARLVTIQAEKVTIKEENPAVKRRGLSEIMNEVGSRRRDSQSGSENSGEVSGDVAGLLRKWGSNEMATGEILEMNPPTIAINAEATMTFELDLAAPLLPIAAPSPIRRSATTLSLITTPPSSKGSDMDLLQWDTVAKPRAAPVVWVESTTEKLQKRAEEITKRRASLVGTPIRSSSSRLSLASTSNRTPLVSSFAPTSTFTSLLEPTPISYRTTTVSHIPAMTRSDSLNSVNEGDTVIFGANTQRGTDCLVDCAMTPAVVRRVIPRVSMAEKRLSLVRPVVAVDVESEGKENGSPRKETTRERLDRAREDRLRRESMRSPEKMGMKSVGSNRGRESITTTPSTSSSRIASPVQPRARLSLVPTAAPTTASIPTRAAFVPAPRSKYVPTRPPLSSTTGLIRPSSIAASRIAGGPSRLIPSNAPPTSSRSSPVKFAPTRSLPSTRPTTGVPVRSTIPTTTSTTSIGGLRRPVVATGLPRAKVPLKSSVQSLASASASRIAYAK